MEISNYIPPTTISQGRDLRYEISKLLGLAGIKSPVYVPYGIQRAKTEPPYAIPDTKRKNAGVVYSIGDLAETLEGELGQSWMGTPIWFPMTFGSGIKKIYDRKTGELTEVQYPDFTLPPTMLVDFTRAKNVVKTQVSGGIGTVKELYGFDDWNINMRGFLLDDKKGGTTSLYKKKVLLSWENCAESIRVVGTLFDEKYVFNIVIENMTIKQVEGKPNAYEFNIDAVSDTAYELEYEKK